MASNSDKSDLEDGEIEDGEILESESEGEVEDKDTSESPSPQQTLKRSRSSGEEDTDTSIPIPPAKREKHDRVNHDREAAFPRRTYGEDSASDYDSEDDEYEMKNRHSTSDNSPHKNNGYSCSDASDEDPSQKRRRQPRSSLEAIQNMSSAFGIKPRPAAPKARKTLLPAPPKDGVEEDNFDLELSRAKLRHLTRKQQQQQPHRGSSHGAFYNSDDRSVSSPPSSRSGPYRRDSVDYRHGHTDSSPVRRETYDHGHGSSKRNSSSHSTYDYGHGSRDRDLSSRSDARASRRSPARDDKNASPAKSSSLSSLTTGHHFDVTVAAAEGDSHLLVDKGRDRGGSRLSARREEKNREWRDRRKREEDEASERAAQRPLVPCRYYMEGRCHKGADCTFSHNVKREKKPELCKFYSQDCCSRGESCLYMHEDFPCKYFHSGTYCFSGPACRFSHDPLTDERRAMLDRYNNLPKNTPDYSDDNVAVSPPPSTTEVADSTVACVSQFKLAASRTMPQRSALLPVTPSLYSSTTTDYDDIAARGLYSEDSNNPSQSQLDSQTEAAADVSQAANASSIGKPPATAAPAANSEAAVEEEEEEEEEEVFIYRPYATAADTSSSIANADSGGKYSSMAGNDDDDSDVDTAPLMIDMEDGEDGEPMVILDMDDDSYESSVGCRAPYDMPLPRSSLRRPKLPTLPPMQRDPVPEVMPQVKSEPAPVKQEPNVIVKMDREVRTTPATAIKTEVPAAAAARQPIISTATAPSVPHNGDVTLLAESLASGSDIDRQQIDILKKLVEVMEKKVNEKQQQHTPGAQGGNSGGLLEEAAETLRAQSTDPHLQSMAGGMVMQSTAMSSTMPQPSSVAAAMVLPLSVSDPRTARQRHVSAAAAAAGSQSPSHYSASQYHHQQQQQGSKNGGGGGGRPSHHQVPVDPRHAALQHGPRHSGAPPLPTITDPHAMQHAADHGVGPRQPPYANQTPTTLSSQQQQQPSRVDPRQQSKVVADPRQDPRQDPRRAAHMPSASASAAATPASVEPPRHALAGSDPRHVSAAVTGNTGYYSATPPSAAAADTALSGPRDPRDPRLRSATVAPPAVDSTPVGTGPAPAEQPSAALGPRRSLLPTPDMKPGSPLRHGHVRHSSQHNEPHSQQQQQQAHAHQGDMPAAVSNNSSSGRDPRTDPRRTAASAAGTQPSYPTMYNSSSSSIDGQGSLLQQQQQQMHYRASEAAVPAPYQPAQSSSEASYHGPRRGVTDPRYKGQHDGIHSQQHPTGDNQQDLQQQQPSGYHARLADSFRHNDPTASPFS